FLGMAECDRHGNVNVSKFGSRLAGAGGFINISQNAAFVCFMGTFTSKCRLQLCDGGLKVLQEGSGRKFVDSVEQITFSGDNARKNGQTVYYVTERAVFRLVEDGLELIEIAPGLDLERDVLAQMDFRPRIAEPLALMDTRLFQEAALGLDSRSSELISERLHYDADTETVFVNFEGLRLDSVAEVEQLAAQLDPYFQQLGKKVKAVVNYDNFVVAPVAEAAYFAMVERNTQKYFTSAVRYSTDAFFRRRVGRKFAAVKSELQSSYDEAVKRLRSLST
ncbi:MAG: acyl CoA:acetate/3-ketoacid CoA transferase, partial [Gammaproteobacteria bacterium]|nr:acyl CoA:acetate/3-ketoacid CoA transferase [Gammaproteobacteria bacterium]